MKSNDNFKKKNDINYLNKFDFTKNDSFGHLMQNKNILNYKEYNKNNINKTNIDPRLEVTLSYLDINSTLPTFITNNISFNDLLLLCKKDLIELGFSLVERNRILHFSQEFKRYGKKYNIQENPANTESQEVYEPIKDFWFNAIDKSCYFLMNDDDKNILPHLINIHSFFTINNDDKGSVFKIVYYFEENEFFTNTEICKVYYYNEKSEEVNKVDFPTINWKEGKKPKKDSFFDMFDEKECKIEESQSEVDFIRNDFLPNILEFYLNFQDDSEADDYDNYI